jgi:curved DNA-binding protein
MAVGFQDYYEALGVPRDASADDIRRAYRKLARQYHPDVNKEAGAEDRFKLVSEAYEVLRDDEKRQRYDRLGANWKAGQDVSGAPGFEEAFRNGGGAGSGFRDVRVDFGGADLGDSGFSDFFDSFFSRSSRRRGGDAGSGGFEGFSMRGSDQEAVLELSLEEAGRGGRRTLTFGDGRTFEVEIPRGVRDGQLIRLAGQGSSGVGGGASGDLLLRVRIRPHPRFRVEGRDLYVDLPVSPWEAALGATVPVPTLDGEAKVTVPEGSSCGRRLRLRGQGLPAGDGGTPGNLYAVVQIRVPKKLTKAERQLFERLEKTSKFDPRKGG